jgi:phosphate transport system substrate-binding protein
MMKNYRLFLGCFLIALFSVLTISSMFAEESIPGNGQSASVKMEGTIRVSGAWALYPMMVRWGEEFQKLYPQIRVDISAGGAGKGLTDALSGLVDLGMVSREIRAEETAKGAVFVPVVKDAVFATMNALNPASAEVVKKGVKKSTFVALWIEGKEAHWGEISGGSEKDTVQVYTRSDSCGAAETWAKYMGKLQEDLKGTAVYGDPGLADAVKKDIYAIGYNNLNFAFDAKSGAPLEGLVVVPIDINENGQIDPNEDISSKAKAITCVKSGTYPAPPARDLNLVTKDAFTGLTKVFVEWILTDGQKFADEAGYINLTEDSLQQAVKSLQKK